MKMYIAILRIPSGFLKHLTFILFSKDLVSKTLYLYKLFCYFKEFSPPPAQHAFTGHQLPFIGFTFTKERYIKLRILYII